MQSGVRGSCTRTAMKERAFPDTVTFLSIASTPLSRAVTVTTPVLLNDPAAILSSLFVLRVKSVAVAGATGSAHTVINVSVSTAVFSVALTVAALADPLSLMRAGVSFRLTSGLSSSLTFTVTDAPGTVPRTHRLPLQTGTRCVIVTVSSARSSSCTPMTATVCAVRQLDGTKIKPWWPA